MRAAKVQASLRMRAVSPEPSLLAHISSESRGTFRRKTRSLAPLNGWTCAVEICHDGMLEDTNSLDGAQVLLVNFVLRFCDSSVTFLTSGIPNLCLHCFSMEIYVPENVQKMDERLKPKPEDYWSCIANLSAEDMLN